MTCVWKQRARAHQPFSALSSWGPCRAGPTAFNSELERRCNFRTLCLGGWGVLSSSSTSHRAAAESLPSSYCSQLCGPSSCPPRRGGRTAEFTWWWIPRSPTPLGLALTLHEASPLTTRREPGKLGSALQALSPGQQAPCSCREGWRRVCPKETNFSKSKG